MPAAPLLMVAANVTGVSAAIGSAVASAVIGSTVSAAVATAVGSGLIAAGVTAVSGGDANDVLKAAVVGGGSAYLGNLAGAKAGAAAQAAGYSDEVSSVMSAAASGGAENTAQALGYGADLGEALQEGAVGALAAGATAGTIEAFKEGKQPGVKIPASGSPSDVPEVGLRAGTPRAAADMDGGTGIVPPSDTFLPRSTRADIAAGRAMIDADGNVIPTMRTPEGRIIPAMANSTGRLTPATESYDLADTSTKYGASTADTIDRPYRPSALGEFGEQVLAQYIYPEFAQAASGLVYGDRASTPSQSTQVGVESTGTPSSAALAQALRVGDAGEPVFGTDDLGKQKRVWNVSSLKLKDEVGG
jgi:hypothetical protein